LNSEKTVGFWCNKIGDWLTAGVAGDKCNTISEVQDEAVAMLLLRECAAGRPLAVMVPDAAFAETVRAELFMWRQVLKLPDSIALCLPPPVSEGFYLASNEAVRSNIIHLVISGHFDIICGSADAFFAPVPLPEIMAEREFLLNKSSKITFTELLHKLVEMDYDDELEVTVKGEFSRRGGIIDIFSPAHEVPVRIEFWGDDIESIREFSPKTQRSTREVDEYRIISRSSIVEDDDEFGDFITYMERVGARLITVFPQRCQERIKQSGHDEYSEKFRSLMAGERDIPTSRIIDPAESAVASGTNAAGCFPAMTHLKRNLSSEIAGGGMELLRLFAAEQIRQWLDTGYNIVLQAREEKSVHHITEWCEEQSIEMDHGNITVDVADLPCGIIFPALKLVMLTEKELFTAGIFKQPVSRIVDQATTAFSPDQEAEALADLDDGDYAVHMMHGIGIYRGLREIERHGVVREVIEMEYRDAAILYVPVWQAGLVSRYVGAKKGGVTLHKIGGKQWFNTKVSAARSIRDFAMDMLKTQAMRVSVDGLVYGDDSLEQRIFEDAFPYNDTQDQIKVSREIKDDMIKAKPMDRLLCGDVGYGKTEIAIRAAFKAVMSGHQVAILVPTTILAQQHYYSFSERFAEYPIVIEMLSRFRSPVEQKVIVSRLREGSVDIVIGTHRLLQKDIDFFDLGLVVVDEEQRFGVRHKEVIKSFRASVDILTMTATPIPRTLYMAMSGARDLSTIVTAPGLRLPIKTVVVQYDEKIIVDAIRNEVGRGGQAFFLHNRVKTIDDFTERLRVLMPEISFVVGHGQMDATELENIMAEFLAGDSDVLVCTTIIESGVDIPNVNTILIDRADRFGLAELYQLRGRVGRWKRQAFAYLILPPGGTLTSDARQRISAIRRYTHLGAGFKLALRDLEIRGAGNLIGTAQSGNINNLGFELYCRLLRSTVSQLKGHAKEIIPSVDLAIDFIQFASHAPTGVVAAGFPVKYIPSDRLRIDIYRRLALLTSVEQLTAFEEELRDRYGNLPLSSINMLKVTELKINTARAGYESITVDDDGKIIIKGGRAIYKINGSVPELKAAKSADEYLEQLLKITRKFAKK
jgi:transcription-repair coupling factor (superfamily II helicase)